MLVVAGVICRLGYRLDVWLEVAVFGCGWCGWLEADVLGLRFYIWLEMAMLRCAAVPRCAGEHC